MTHSASADSHGNRNVADLLDRDGHHAVGSLGNTSRVLDASHLDGDQVSAELHHLRRRVETLPVIEQAKGILMLRYGVDADTAFDVLRRLACNHNIKLRDVSRSIVAVATSNPPSTGPQLSLSQLLHDLMSGSDRAN